MPLRIVLILAALALAAPACVVHTMEPGAVTADGSVYLGFNLYSGKGKTEREDFPIGQQHGAFSSLLLSADKTVALGRVVVIFADGERFSPRLGNELRPGQSTQIVLPRGPRPVHSVVVDARSRGKGLASIEIHGRR